jgi:two-component system, OmpR family, sensor histidine kinase MprB
MTFRARIAIAAAAAVALAVVLASLVVFFLVRDQLRSQVDEALEVRAEQIAHRPLDFESQETFSLSMSILSPGFGERSSVTQVVKADGSTLRQYPNVELPVPDAAVGVARGSAQGFFSDADISGTHARMLTFQVRPGVAVQIARALTEVDESLARLRTFLIIIALAGIGGAAALGLIVSNAALAPVRRLTDTAERVTKTGDLSERIEVSGKDELSSLATSFNSMLAALEDSTRAQRQLVADASHELRTPLTSLRTNIEVLASDRALPVEERKRLLSDVVEQLGEMTSLIAELIELARAEQQVAESQDVRLDLAAADALERARRNHPDVRFSSTLAESTVHGVSSTIERAIGNLLDNAAKWTPAGAEVELAVTDGVVTVRDHGPGIAEEDLPYVFDRFYRARTARGMPGSGLGLAIVRQVAEAHGGDVVAESAAGGGTRIVLRLDGSVPGDGPADGRAANES